MAKLIHLHNRAVIKISGSDADAFLQGLISNDVSKLSNDNIIYAALLTPQGKFLFDFFLSRRGTDIYSSQLKSCDEYMKIEAESPIFRREASEMKSWQANSSNNKCILLDIDAARKDELVKQLSKYLLRRNVKIENTEHNVVASLDDVKSSDYLRDPRHAEMGCRLICDNLPEITGNYDDYNNRRLQLAIPDGIADMEAEKTLLLEARFDEINGVDFNKGCYVGQEVTTRSKFRGNVRKKLVGVRLIEGTMPSHGAEILLDNNRIGEMRSSNAEYGIALLQIENLAPESTLKSGEAKLSPYGYTKYK